MLVPDFMSGDYGTSNNMDSPLILITTCRRPFPRMRTFSKDLSRILPNAKRVTRGKQSLRELVEKAVLQGCSRLIILERWRMGACKISFHSINSFGLESPSPKIYVQRFVTHLEREQKGSKIPTVHALVLLSEEKPAKRLSSFLSRFLGMKLMRLKDLGDSSSSAMIVSENREGRVRLSVGNRDSPNNVPSLSIRRIVWDRIGA
jgi:rRNA maturation protein Rpf1